MGDKQNTQRGHEIPVPYRPLSAFPRRTFSRPSTHASNRSHQRSTAGASSSPNSPAASGRALRRASLIAGFLTSDPSRRAALPAAPRCPAALYGFADVHCRGGAGAAIAVYVWAASSCTPRARPRRGGRRGEGQLPLLSSQAGGRSSRMTVRSAAALSSLESDSLKAMTIT